MGGVVLLAGLMAFVVPAWRSYFQATTLAADHGERLARALAAGDDDRASADLDELVRRLGEADELFPYRADFARMMADALVRFEDYEAALLAYRLADQRVPGTFESLNAIGRLLLQLDRPEEAIEPLRLAVISHRGMESVETYALLGRAYMRARRNEEAWIVYDDLINRHYYHVEQPRILKEAAWTLVALDRYLTLAGIMLDEYSEQVPTDHGPELEGLVKHVVNRLAQPRKVRLPPDLADRSSP
jgi:tetratricopeptide (TPR) repeat protein